MSGLIIRLCACGCGEPTKLAGKTYFVGVEKIFKGQPTVFLKGHSNSNRHQRGRVDKDECSEGHLLTPDNMTMSVDGRRLGCTKCRRDRTKRWQYSKRAAAVNLTVEELNDFFEQADGECEVCHRQVGEDKLHVDHNHETNQYRGLVCGNCNIGFGQFGDNPNFLEAAAKYLRNRGYYG